jgi:DNA-binding response OmpR family regulator
MSSRILVVEDDPGIADFLVRGLSEEGYQVEHAKDGLTGRILFEGGGWDLAILDWWLPKLEGIDVLRQVRLRDRTTPALFLTARDDVSQRVEALDAGADDYLCKPFAFEEFLARVRALLRRPAQRDSLTLEYADVKADLASQRAMRSGMSLDLTAKEFSLLCLFLRHPGTVLTRTRIVDAVWGDRYEGASNTIEVHIKELRRKMEAYGPRLIRTLRGRGYLMEADAPQADS